jgi:hypothetical protein
MEAEDTGGETKIKKTRKEIEGRRYMGKDRDREDKEGDGRQKIQGGETYVDREDKKGDVRQKIQGERLR